MGYSFEDLVVRSPMVKTDRNFHKWFESYDFFLEKSHDIKYTCSLYMLNFGPSTLRPSALVD
jgi:hypothetical protein